MTLQLERRDPLSPYQRPQPPTNYDTVFIAMAMMASVGLVVLAAYLAFGEEPDGGFEIGDGTTMSGTSTTSSDPATSTPSVSGRASSTTDLEPSTAGPSTVSTSNTTTSPTTGDPTTSETTSTSTTSTTTTSSTTAASTTATSASTTSTTTSSTTAASTTDGSTSSSPPTTSPVEPVPDVVWPNPGETNGFDTPEDAAHSFAVDLAGFQEPVIGELQADDERSAEIEIRPSPTGPVTQVLLRRAGADDSWWVVGALTDGIVLDRPQAGDTTIGTLHLVGQARADQGPVTVTVYRHGDDGPLAQSFVTGRGDDELGPFEKDIDVYPSTPGPGLVILTSRSDEDGSAWSVTAIPLHLS